MNVTKVSYQRYVKPGDHMKTVIGGLLLYIIILYYV